MGPSADGASDGGESRRDDVRGIEESLRELGSTGRATWEAGRDAAKAFRILVSADISLARSAFGRTLAFTGVAIAFGASSWLLLMAALISWLSLGLGWPWACALVVFLNLAAAVWAGLRAIALAPLLALPATLRRLSDSDSRERAIARELDRHRERERQREGVRS